MTANPAYAFPEATISEEDAICFDCPLDDCDESDPRCPKNAGHRERIVPRAGRGNRRLDWEAIRREYSRQTGRRYDTVSAMLIHMYRSMTIREIAERIGVVDSTVRYQFRRHGIEPRRRNILPPEKNRPKSPKRKRFDALSDDEIRSMTHDELARATGYSKGGVLARCAARGVFYSDHREFPQGMRRQEYRDDLRRRFDAIPAEKVARRSNRWIARYLGCDPSYIPRACAARGVETKTMIERRRKRTEKGTQGWRE